MISLHIPELEEMAHRQQQKAFGFSQHLLAACAAVAIGCDHLHLSGDAAGDRIRFSLLDLLHLHAFREQQKQPASAKRALAKVIMKQTRQACLGKQTRSANALCLRACPKD